jgi:hypothetical protein
MPSPVPDLESFIAEHLAQDRALKKYATTPRGSQIVSDALLARLRDDQAKSLKATNARSRIAVARAIRSALNQARRQWEGMPAERTRRLDQLKANQRKLQLERYLDRLNWLRPRSRVSALAGSRRSSRSESRRPWTSLVTRFRRSLVSVLRRMKSYCAGGQGWRRDLSTIQTCR